MKTPGCVVVGLGFLLVAGCGPTPEQFHQYGMNHFHREAYVDAIAMFNAALESGPERPDTLYYMGECYRKMARRKLAAGDVPASMRGIDKSILFYNQAIESHPGHAPALRAKGDVLELKGRTEQALATARWAGENLGNVERGARYYVDWGKRLEDLKDYDGAKLRYEQAVAVDPTNAWAMARLGGFYERLGDAERAADTFRQAYRLNPTEPGVARSLRRLGYYPAEPASPAAAVGEPNSK